MSDDYCIIPYLRKVLSLRVVSASFSVAVSEIESEVPSAVFSSAPCSFLTVSVEVDRAAILVEIGRAHV